MEMKNLIRILLYLLLVLLVVAISVVVYKKFKAPAETELSTDTADSTMTDSLAVDNMALTAEDSMILGLTPTTTTMLDPMVEQTTGMDQSTSTQTTNTVPPVPKENVSPVAKPVNNTSVAEKPATSVSKKSNNTASTSKASSSKATTSKSGKYYVVAGSYIVPSHADKQVAKLKKMGYSTATSKVFGSDEYYRAIAGQYDTRESADKTVRNLKVKGQDAFVKTN